MTCWIPENSFHSFRQLNPVKLPVGEKREEMQISEGALTESQRAHLINITERPSFQYFCSHQTYKRPSRAPISISFYQGGRLHVELVSSMGRILSSKVVGS